MKKQLFILIVLALFAGMSNVYAQTCEDGPLAPVAGKQYDYQVTIPNTNGYTGNGPFTWYVTTNPNLFESDDIVETDAGEIIATGAGAYNSPIPSANTINIEWTPQAIQNYLTGTPYYLVIKYSEQPSGSCEAMNLKVWEIKPLNKFLLTPDTLLTSTFCPGVITGATVSGSTVNYNYGTTIITAKVNAKYYTGDWKPSFSVNGTDVLQQVQSVVWDTDQAFTNSYPAPLVSGVFVADGLAPSSYAGTDIYVKVVIANNTFANSTTQTITIAFDGYIPVGATDQLNDVKSEVNCEDEVPFGKSVTLTVNPRPGIQSGIPGGNFIGE